MFPLGLLKIIPLVAAMQIVVTTLPSGDTEQTTFLVTEDGVRATVLHKTARSDISTRRQFFVKKARYTWRIDEERKTILMALPGQPTGVVQSAFSVSGSMDMSQRPTDAPRPVEVCKFYAPTKEAAVAMRDRLKKALG